MFSLREGGFSSGVTQPALKCVFCSGVGLFSCTNRVATAIAVVATGSSVCGGEGGGGAAAAVVVVVATAGGAGQQPGKVAKFPGLRIVAGVRSTRLSSRLQEKLRM